jgi:hypothetical protein
MIQLSESKGGIVYSCSFKNISKFSKCDLLQTSCIGDVCLAMGTNSQQL